MVKNPPASAGDTGSIPGPATFHMPQGNQAHVSQLLRLTALKPVLHNKGSRHNEKPAHGQEEEPPPTATREKPAQSNEDPAQAKITNK